MAFYNSIPFIGKYLRSNRFLNQFSAEEKKKIREEYRESLGFGLKFSFSDDSFDKLISSRKKDLDGFSTTKNYDGSIIHAKLVLDNDNANSVRSAITEALTPTLAFNRAQKNYKNLTSNFNDLVKLIPEKFSAKDLISTLTKLTEEGRAAIVAQQTREKQLLSEKLRDPVMFTKFKTSLGLDADPAADEKANKAIDNLLKDLGDSHTKQLGEFDKTTTASIKKLHDAAYKEMMQMVFIANLHKNPKMRADIEKKAEENRIENGAPKPKVKLKYTATKAYISGINMSDLETIQSITGSIITIEGDGCYSVQMSNKWRSPFYYNDPRQSVETDMRTLAEAVRACGYEDIEMDVDFSDPDLAIKRACQAYEQCIMAGFEPGKITINVNGKPIKADELFKDQPSRLQECKRIAPNIAAEIKTIKETWIKEQPTSQGLNKASNKAIIDEAERLAQAKEQRGQQPGPGGN